MIKKNQSELRAKMSEKRKKIFNTCAKQKKKKLTEINELEKIFRKQPMAFLLLSRLNVTLQNLQI